MRDVLTALVMVALAFAMLGNIDNGSKDEFSNAILGTMSSGAIVGPVIHGAAVAASKPRVKCNVAIDYTDPQHLYCPDLGRVLRADSPVLKEMLVEITQTE